MTTPPLVLYAGSASELLTRAVAQCLHLPLGQRALGRHNDGSPRVQLLEKVRGSIVVLVQSLCPMDQAWTELIALIDAATRASAAEIWVVMPYFAGRQDKGDELRVDITASWALRMLETLGVNRFFSLDLHSGQTRGFVRIPFDHLSVLPLLVEKLAEEKTIELRQTSFVSPDAGGVKRTRNLARRFAAANMILIDKERVAAGVNRAHAVIGKPAPVCVIVDDIADTLGTLCQAAEALKAAGAKHVYAAVTHPVLGGAALENLSQSAALEYLAVSDTIPLAPAAARDPKIGVVSVAPVIAEALERIHTGASLHEMEKFSPGQSNSVL